ncbi:hypothetical protein GCM10007907_30100 [Chitinimonas prasina]|uniref:DUF2169 domain-containing protein n=1 Tax=Chitinimonas prasina TaxID=1434937 RepID=A0ABQ5YGT6_9NEIS|nr:DUF2169 domain-containing protein [Chitinimonas prasina]GLR14220.1 hypothetical protein GCM10007907_30100 [Chitinimonas prasina]
MSVETINTTPFSVFSFEHMLFNGRRYQIVVLKQSYGLRDTGAVVQLHQQRPVRLGDVHLGERDRSSVLLPTDLIPYKPKCEVIVTGTAQIAQPSDSWLAGIAIGDWKKALRLYGPRRWQKTLLGRWKLTDAEPTTSTPLLYEHAYGGHFELLNEQGEMTVAAYGLNPAGTGWLGEQPHITLTKAQRKALDERVAQLDTLQAPRIEYPQQAIGTPGEDIAPAGLGAFPAWWRGRTQYLDGMAPIKPEQQGYPSDFDMAHWQQAPADQWLPFALKGGETLVLANLLPEGRQEYVLPRSRPFLFLRSPTDLSMSLDMDIDTVLVDLDARVLELTWRRIVQLDELGPELQIEVIS